MMAHLKYSCLLLCEEYEQEAGDPHAFYNSAYT